MPFDLAKSFSGKHLIVQPSDAALDPPESYLYVQDGLIIACGLLYVLCYVFYMIRTYKDRHIAGPVEYLCGTMAYELYYAFVMTESTFELGCFLAWFAFDVAFAAVAITTAYPPHRRLPTVLRMVIGVSIGLGVFHRICNAFPDQREQVTAYWTGWLLELPIGYGSLIGVLRGDTRGQSLEIWATRFLGCLTADGVFRWRYLNIPDNWAYVGSSLSTALVVATILPEVVYPFAYIRLYRAQKHKLKCS